MAKPVLYWDACMFYEVLGNEPVGAGKRAAVKEILAENDKEENLIVTSVITHLEVLPDKLADKGASDEDDYLALFDAKHYLGIELSTNILFRAREIRNFYYTAADANGSGGKMMDLGDAIHLASATIYGASEFHTRDNRRGGSKVPLLDLYKVSGEPHLCGKYNLKILSPESEQGDLLDGQ